MKYLNIKNLRFLTLPMVLFGFLLITSCGDDDDNNVTITVPEGEEGDDIVTLASATSDLSTLVEALGGFSDLVAALSDTTEEFTVFAPNNAAFTALLTVVEQENLSDIPSDVVRRILDYHVVAGEAFAGDLTDGQTITTLLGEELTIGVDGANVTVNGVSVVTPDIDANNGVVHIVDGVLTPALETSIVNTILEPAYFNIDFSILTAAVVKAELVETLITSTTDGYTLFAPNDAAFTAAGVTSLDNLSKEDLTPILQYHVLGAEVLESELPTTGSAVTTLNGDFYLSINSEGVFINGQTQVTATDLLYDNGVVHTIDQTLLPASDNVVDVAVGLSQGSPAEFTQLVSALTAVQTASEEPEPIVDALISILSAETDDEESLAPFTVFAPTDAAFNALYAALEVSDLEGVVSAIGIDGVELVLKYHVIAGARVFSTDLPNLSSTTQATVAGQDITFDLTDLTITEADGTETDEDTDAGIIGTDVLGTNGVIHTIDKVLLPLLGE